MSETCDYSEPALIQSEKGAVCMDEEVQMKANQPIVLLVTIVLSLSLFVSSCGLIVHGTSQDITVNSSPSEAKAIVRGDTKTTPAVFDLKRKHSYTIKVSKDGYETVEVIINNKLDCTAWVDIFLFGVIPVFVDLATGAAWKLSPEDLNVNLPRSIGSLDGPQSIPVRVEIQDGQLHATSKLDGIVISVKQAD